MNSMRMIMSNNTKRKLNISDLKKKNKKKQKFKELKSKTNRKTYLNIFNVEIIQKMLGQFEPS